MASILVRLKRAHLRKAGSPPINASLVLDLRVPTARPLPPAMTGVAGAETVSGNVAALHFSLAHPAVVAVVPGSRRRPATSARAERFFDRAANARIAESSRPANTRARVPLMLRAGSTHNGNIA